MQDGLSIPSDPPTGSRFPLSKPFVRASYPIGRLVALPPPNTFSGLIPPLALLFSSLPPSGVALSVTLLVIVPFHLPSAAPPLESVSPFLSGFSLHTADPVFLLPGPLHLR